MDSNGRVLYFPALAGCLVIVLAPIAVHAAWSISSPTTSTEIFTMSDLSHMGNSDGVSKSFIAQFRLPNDGTVMNMMDVTFDTGGGWTRTLSKPTGGWAVGANHEFETRINNLQVAEVTSIEVKAMGP